MDTEYNCCGITTWVVQLMVHLLVHKGLHVRCPQGYFHFLQHSFLHLECDCLFL